VIIFEMWVFFDKSDSTYIPRFCTYETDLTTSEPKQTELMKPDADVGLNYTRSPMSCPNSAEVGWIASTKARHRHRLRHYSEA